MHAGLIVNQNYKHSYTSDVLYKHVPAQKHFFSLEKYSFCNSTSNYIQQQQNYSKNCSPQLQWQQYTCILCYEQLRSTYSCTKLPKFFTSQRTAPFLATAAFTKAFKTYRCIFTQLRQPRSAATTAAAAAAVTYSSTPVCDRLASSASPGSPCYSRTRRGTERSA